MMQYDIAFSIWHYLSSLMTHRLC